MVLNGVKENVSRNLGESTSFTIEANEAAFQILTDKLYKYPIRAIVRELAANAIDANRVSKSKLNNWEITLPNSINPMFAIEDFGVGMTDTEIKEVYTTFFKSTKSSSNDQTGMFGLGSKTPFAYTKQFIVESSKDGFKNIYSMHSENGKPEVIKVNPEPIPTDKTGTKVSFAVNIKDFKEFYDAMIYSSAVWPGLPKINGSSEFYSYLKNKKWESEAEPEIILENTNKVYSSMEKVPTSEDFVKVGNDKFYLEMGNVLYYVSLEQLDIDSIYYNVLGSYIIHAPIGSVSITPNREDLQYDEKTKEFLNKEIISTVIKNFEFNFDCFTDDKFLKIINTDESKLNAAGKKALKNLIKQYKDLGKVIQNVDKQFTSREVFVIESFILRYSSKCLTSAWRPLNGIFDKTDNAGYKFLKHLNQNSKANIKLIELKEGEYNRYKISDGALTGFFNSRLNRINRDMFAKVNGRVASDTQMVTRYGAENVSTPIYIFCKEGNSDFIKSLYPSLQEAEIITDFSKLPNSFDYFKTATGEKVKDDICDKKTLEVRFNDRISLFSLNELKAQKAGATIILLNKPGREYEAMDFEKYFTQKISLDSLKKYQIDRYSFDRLLNSYNSKSSTEYLVVVGKPSELKKMKINECKEFNFINIKDNGDSYNNFIQKLADEIAESYLKELEKLPVSVKSQSILSDRFMEVARNCLDIKSEFLSEIEAIKKDTLSDKELEKRTSLITNVRAFKLYNSPAILQRIEKYSGSSIQNMNEEVKNSIKKFPLGSDFLDKYYTYYYSGDSCWRDYSKLTEFFKIVNLVEKDI